MDSRLLLLLFLSPLLACEQSASEEWDASSSLDATRGQDLVGIVDGGAPPADTLRAPELSPGDEEVLEDSSPPPSCVVIEVLEGTTVSPQTLLHLSASGPALDGLEVLAFQWSVQQPDGSLSLLLPSDQLPHPTFEANIVGPITFSLELTLAAGEGSCVADPVTVLVVSDQAIHIELTWETPQDPDPYDEGPEAGTDLDLHFKHPKAMWNEEEGWFHQPFDCYWFNPHPNWGSLDPEAGDDPTLARDDTDGAGPENLNLGSPEDGQLYALAVHVHDDHAYGPSWARVRVYIFGALVLETAPVELVSHDLWKVATIQWPSQEVVALTGEGGGPHIISAYESPLFAP